MDVGFLINSWLGSVLRRKAKNTHTAYKRALYRFEDSLPANCQVAHVTAEHLERYVLSLPFPASTVNTHLSAIKAFFNWCEEIHGLPNIGQKVKCLKKSLPKQRVLSRAEYEKLLSVCNPDEKRIVQFLAMTGIRTCGLKSITEGSFKNGCVYVRGKGKFRAVPLNRTAIEASTPITYFVKLSKNFSKTNHLYYFITHLCKRAGIEKAGPHALRHLFATEMLKHTSLKKTSLLMGHSSTRVTEDVYCHLSPEVDLQGVTDVLDD